MCIRDRKRTNGKNKKMAARQVLKRVLVPIANGSEEIETVAIIDTLRRAGAEVTVASVENELQVECSRGVRLVADVHLRDKLNEKWDLIALPGGLKGAEKFRDTKELMDLFAKQQKEDLPHAALCATPAVALGPHGLLDGRKATCHPSFKSKFPEKGIETNSRVVVDGNLVTSQGPGTAIEFALSLVELLFGKEKAHEVGKPMLVPGYE
eukprot:TRINITY_DN536_c0_g1_i2.p1 TRINITY_DN536_c0_g1~~TRINITY_DN536_c0_g1_i2.p1  ORF type:complete len:209 (+),score=54.32 TRINITY_DN536_c0_g1_i2:48-674(+)